MNVWRMGYLLDVVLTRDTWARTRRLTVRDPDRLAGHGCRTVEVAFDVLQAAVLGLG
ncbi:MAG: hypothetical protein QOE40_2013, partial [Actinomycetota bacterium]|nr:hypothetical protein [Actinomycetota bacterium]